VLFSDDSIPLIQEVPQGGLLRPVNNLATQALIAAQVARELARFPGQGCWRMPMMPNM
jgi:type II secretory pathway predicted ATPase ExeA